MTTRSILSRPLPFWAAAITSLLAFGVVFGLVSAAAERAGISPRWAFALGWNTGFALLLGRHYVAASQYSRATRWRAFGRQLALMILLTAVVTAFSGAHIFAAAT